MSSGRVLASHKATKKQGFPCNDHVWRNNKKICDLQKVKPSPQHMMNMSNNAISTPVFSVERPKEKFRTKLVTA
jgi:hypothetical protein